MSQTEPGVYHLGAQRSFDAVAAALLTSCTLITSITLSAT